MIFLKYIGEQFKLGNLHFKSETIFQEIYSSKPHFYNKSKYMSEPGFSLTCYIFRSNTVILHQFIELYLYYFLIYITLYEFNYLCE